MTLSDILSPPDIQTILQKLGIQFDHKRSDQKGWITTKSPLREDNNPSFGLNVQTGAYKDHGSGESGDIVNLVETLKKLSNQEAISWIKDQINIDHNPDNYFRSETSQNRRPQRRMLATFWTPKRILEFSEAQQRLENEPDHFLLKQAINYDQLTTQTLQHFGCGILEQYGQDWLAFPYETGCQLYRRENDTKQIRNLKGSRPGKTFFGTRCISDDKKALLIAKSPREAMLLHQTYPDGPNVIGLATGELGKLSHKQIKWLRNEISVSAYNNIFILLDCDTKDAYSTAKNLARNIKNLTLQQEVSLVNVYNFTDEKSKDFTDLIKHGVDEHTLQGLFKEREIIQHLNQTILTTYEPDISPEDLKLPQSLVKLLPSVVKDFLKFGSPLSDVPDEFLLTPFLAIAGSAIGRRRYIKVGGLQIYPTIWTVLFAGSSVLRKSTALSIAKKPFKPILERFQEKYKKELTRWEQEKEYCEENDEPFDMPEPIKKTLYCPDGFSDLTYWESLRDNGSLVSTPSEFTALWSELARPRNSMRDLILRIFDAEDSIRRVTKSGGNIQLRNPVWCLAGATTLTNFQRSLTKNERASGLLQRILPVYREKRIKQFRAVTELREPNLKLYHQITDKTIRLAELDTRPVHISAEARELYTQWSHQLDNRAKKLTDRLTDIGGYTSRLNIYGLKFGLIFQQLDQETKPISKRNMQAAIALCEWLFNHIIYMLDRNYIFNQNYADRVKIRKLIEKQPNQVMNRTDLMNLSNFDKDRLDKAVNSDIEAGKIEETKIKTQGRDRIEYKRKHAT